MPHCSEASWFQTTDRFLRLFRFLATGLPQERKTSTPSLCFLRRICSLTRVPMGVHIFWNLVGNVNSLFTTRQATGSRLHFHGNLCPFRKELPRAGVFRKREDWNHEATRGRLVFVPYCFLLLGNFLLCFAALAGDERTGVRAI